MMKKPIILILFSVLFAITCQSKDVKVDSLPKYIMNLQLSDLSINEPFRLELSSDSFFKEPVPVLLPEKSTKESVIELIFLLAAIIFTLIAAMSLAILDKRRLIEVASYKLERIKYDEKNNKEKNKRIDFTLEQFYMHSMKYPIVNLENDREMMQHFFKNLKSIIFLSNSEILSYMKTPIDSIIIKAEDDLAQDIKVEVEKEEEEESERLITLINQFYQAVEKELHRRKLCTDNNLDV